MKNKSKLFQLKNIILMVIGLFSMSTLFWAPAPPDLSLILYPFIGLGIALALVSALYVCFIVMRPFLMLYEEIVKWIDNLFKN